MSLSSTSKLTALAPPYALALDLPFTPSTLSCSFISGSEEGKITVWRISSGTRGYSLAAVASFSAFEGP